MHARQGFYQVSSIPSLQTNSRKLIVLFSVTVMGLESRASCVEASVLPISCIALAHRLLTGIA